MRAFPLRRRILSWRISSSSRFGNPLPLRVRHDPKTGTAFGNKKSPGHRRGSFKHSDSLLHLHAGVVGVRPLVLVGVAAGADERRGRPGALVVGLGAGRAVPPGVDRIGGGFAGLVADEMLLVLHV